MPKAGDLKKGMVVEVNGAPHIVKTRETVNPSSRGAATLIKVRFNNLLTKQKLDASFKSEEMIADADCIRMQLAFSYQDDNEYVFMNIEDYSQHSLDLEAIEEEVGYITDGLEGIVGLVVNGHLVSIELPQSVNLEIVDTAPGLKGASATNRTKPATLSTGIEIQVPEYITIGELVKVNTSTKTFMQRA